MSTVGVLRRAVESDLAAIVVLNEANVTHLSPLTAAALQRLSSYASYFCVAEIGGALAGFLLAVGSEAPYEGENFLWFKSRYAGFLYVDRIVVGAHARRAGIASQLYEGLETHASASQASLITCEINQRPPNPESLAFHERRGFVEVGTREVDDGAKSLSMRLKRIRVA